MPWWIILYVIVFGLVAFFNVCYLIHLKSKVLIVFYDLFAAAFMIFMIFAYWLTFIRDHLTLMILPAFIVMLVIDMRLTIFGDILQLGMEIPEGMTEKDVETAGALSLLFAAPAYIIGGLVCLDRLVLFC